MFWDVDNQICVRICWISAVGRSKDRVRCLWKLHLPKSLHDLFLLPGRGWGHPEQKGKAGWTSRQKKKVKKNNQGTKNTKGCGVFHLGDIEKPPGLVLGSPTGAQGAPETPPNPSHPIL